MPDSQARSVSGLAEAIATTPGAGYTSEHLPTAECPLDLVDGAARYGPGICVKMLLAGARGDEAAHRDFLQQHRAMATKLGRLGHMAMADSWTVRAAVAGASRLLSTRRKCPEIPC